jgi:hypothetical protein
MKYKLRFQYVIYIKHTFSDAKDKVNVNFAIKTDDEGSEGV